MPSHNLARIEIDDLEILGYSVAGEETVVAIPQLSVCFDIGKAPDQIIPISHILLTHGHIDHSAGVAYYLSHRQFCGMSPGTILAPENLLVPISQITDAWGRLDGSRIPAELVGLKSGDEFQIKPNLFARTFATNHTAGSIGFCIIEKRKKLKVKYHGLRAPELVKLKEQGETIEEQIEIPLVTYLGDTRYSDFSKHDFIVKSKILIAECTFVDEEHIERALAGRHMYVDEFAQMIEGFENEHIIITHLTQRTHVGLAKKILKQKLPKKQYDKVIILMDRKHRQMQQ